MDEAEEEARRRYDEVSRRLAAGEDIEDVCTRLVFVRLALLRKGYVYLVLPKGDTGLTVGREVHVWPGRALRWGRPLRLPLITGVVEDRYHGTWKIAVKEMV